jgi:hypothetical protein
MPKLAEQKIIRESVINECVKRKGNGKAMKEEKKESIITALLDKNKEGFAV